MSCVAKVTATPSELTVRRRDQMGREARTYCRVFRTSVPGTVRGKCLLSGDTVTPHVPAKRKGSVRRDWRYG